MPWLISLCTAAIEQSYFVTDNIVTVSTLRLFQIIIMSSVALASKRSHCTGSVVAAMLNGGLGLSCNTHVQSIEAPSIANGLYKMPLCQLI